MTVLHYRVVDLLDDVVAHIVEDVEACSIEVQIERPMPVAFTIDEPDPDVQTVAQGLIAFLASCPAWRIEDEGAHG